MGPSREMGRALMLGRFADRVQGLMARSGAGRPDEKSEPATVGFVERLRDEWKTRNDLAARPDRFGLRELLSTRAAGGSAILDAPAFMHDERVDTLPTERLDAGGNTQPLDDAFFARDRYRLSELTGFPDAVFIEVAFRCVLKRRPDPPGFANFLRGMRSGSLDRIDVVRGLWGSGEGKRAAVTIDGLARVAFWRRAGRAPVVGPLVRWLLVFARLPRLADEQRVFQAQTLAWQQRQALRDESIHVELERLKVAITALEDTGDEIGDVIVDLANRVQRLKAEMALDGTAPHARSGGANRRLVRQDPAERTRADAASPADQNPPIAEPPR